MVANNDGERHRRLSDTQLTASSSYKAYAPNRGRLNMEEFGQDRSGWCANTKAADPNPYFQVNFSKLNLVSRIFRIILNHMDAWILF